MPDAPERPQITLITPPEIDLATFPDRLAAVLDATPIACLRLSLASRDEDQIARSADALRAIAHARDIALVIDTHFLMVARLGLDGVHLPDGARTVRYVRKELRKDAIVGAYCGTLRHDAMSAAELGADYVSFGPVAASALGDGKTADHDLFSWWSEIFEVPVIAEGGLTADLIAELAPVTDFYGIGPEIWGQDDPSAALKALLASLGQ